MSKISTADLGYGVYVDYDGYSITMCVNDPENPHKIFLSPETVQAFIKYAKRMGVIDEQV